MRAFVMGDIHGSFKALKQCLERSQFDYQKDRLIVLGDIVDRHDEVYECVEELLKIPDLIALRGNHDDWLDEFCQTGRHPADWNYGGLATVASYLGQGGDKRPAIAGGYALTYIIKPQDIPERHQKFFSEMRPYYIDEQGRCFVHAGFNRFFPFIGQHPSIYYWDRELWASAWEWQINKRLNPDQSLFELKTRFEEVYVGHTSTTQ
jgi:serine/threonine protein phosphatase 1